MLTCHFCTAQSTSFNEWYIFYNVCNWAAQDKQISDRLEYITHLHQHTLHGQYTTPTCSKCAYKISQIFSRVFEFTLAEKPRNPRKLMYREYFHVYSMLLATFTCTDEVWGILIFQNYNPITMTWVHTQLNYKRKLHEFLFCLKPSIFWENWDTFEVQICRT